MPENGPWVLAGSPAAIERLAPLVAARRERQPVVILPAKLDDILASPATHLPGNTSAVLLVGQKRRGPRRALPGLFLKDAQGVRVPLGWLPDVPERLGVYASAAAAVLARETATGPVVVLAQWEDRFLRSALRTSRWFGQHGSVPVFHWSSDRIVAADMLEGLKGGPGVAVYYGHGRARGWAGYRGVRAGDFSDPWPEPVGVLLALCCENASRPRGGLSFAEELALRGVAGCVFAATMKTRHEHNRLLGPALCEELARRTPATLAEWIMRTEVPAELIDRTPYRFIGDPLMAPLGAAESLQHCEQVFAPAPDEPLPAYAEG